MSGTLTIETLVTLREAAELLDVPLATVRQAATRGQLGPRVLRGNVGYFAREDVLAYRPTGRRGGRPRAAIVAEDAEWLLRSGEEADSIRRRCGYETWGAFCAVLTRNGYSDLVRRIQAWTEACGHTVTGLPMYVDRKTHAVW